MDRESLPPIVVPDRNMVRSEQPGQTPTSDHVAVTVGEPLQNPVVQMHEGLEELEIRSLLWMEQKGNEVLARAYVAWEKKNLFFANRIEQKKVQINSRRNEAYFYIISCAVFQGGLLTAVGSSSLFRCYDWWSPFFLSLFTSVVTLGGVIQKFRAILALDNAILHETFSRQTCITRMSKLRQKRGDFRFDVDAAERKRREFDERRLQRSFALVVVILVIFASSFLFSIYRILCNHGALSPT